MFGKVSLGALICSLTVECDEVADVELDEADVELECIEAVG